MINFFTWWYATFLVFLAAVSIDRSVGQNPIQVKGRVKDRIDYFISRPVKALDTWNDYYKIGGFPNNMNAPDRDAVARYIYSIKLNSDNFNPFYAMEDGLFLGYIPMDEMNTSVPVLHYREPGQGGYDPQTSKMAIHWETCVNKETGAEKQCVMSQGEKFVACMNNCEYIKCTDSDSQNDCSTLSGEAKDDCESNVTWCRHYSVKEATGDPELGYIPTTYFCIDIHGLNSQTEDEVLLEKRNGDTYLGDCTFGSGALVDRYLSGPYAYCGGDGKICNTTFVGGKGSHPYDARTRPWYNQSKVAQRQQWSDAYVFANVEVVGITATCPIKGRDADGRTVFLGVLAADFQLGEISGFLEKIFQDTKHSIAIYEASNPNYMIATSTGNDFISKVPKVDESQPCPDGEHGSDGNSEWCLVRNTIDNLEGSNNDTVLRNAHRKLRLELDLDEKKYDVVDLKYETCEDNCTFVAVKGDCDDVTDTTYLAGYFLYNDSEANLDWEVIVAFPLERDPEDALTPGDASWVFVIVISLLGFTICLALLFVFIWHGNEQAVMLSDYKFTAAFVLMTSFLNLASLSMLGDVTNKNCMINMWVFNMLVVCALSPLFVKTYRTWRLLGRSTSSYGKAKMSNFKAWMWTLPIPLVEVIILTIVTLVDPPKVVESIYFDGQTPLQSLSCGHNSDALGVIDTIYFMILIFVGCVLAFLTRRIDSRYADSKALIFVMYNLATVVVFIVAITELAKRSTEAYLSNEVIDTMTAIGIFWICVFSCAIFTLPRVTKAKRDRIQALRELSRQRQAEKREITKRSLDEVSRASHGIHKSDDSLKVLVCAANIGNAEPTLASMKAWIPEQGKCDAVTTLNGDPIDAERFDIIAIGMQESTWSTTNKGTDDTEKNTLARQETEDDLEDNQDRHGSIDETQNYIAALEGEDTFALRDMERKILGERYTLVKEEIRGQMRLYIWSLKGLAPFLDDVKVSGANTGIGNVLANKGGIVVSFEYQKTRFSFLSAHLAAHEGESYYQARCENMRDILRSAKPFDLGGQKFDLTVSSHHMFAFGDLNFRTKFAEKGEHKENVQRALDLINKQDFETLYSHDELHKGILGGDLLLGTQTLPCNFHPTFKVHREPGFTYTEKRTPSYTDRIVFKSGVGLDGCLLPLSYEACVDFVTSDHKPVRGAFSVLTNEMVDQLDLGCRFLLTFSEMECFDLPAANMNGLSDPFLMFVWDSIDMQEESTRGFRFPRFFSGDDWPCTSYISKTLNPKFKGKEIVLSSIGHEVSREAVLLVSAWDYDFGSRNTRLGTLPLSILDLVSMEQNQSTKELSFDRLLEANGKYAGRIKFKVVVSMIIG